MTNTISVAKQVTGLHNLSHQELRQLWTTLNGKEPPAYNRTYLITRLSYRLQEIAYGGLSHLARTTMRQVLADNGYDENGFEPTTRRRYRKNRLNLAVGTTLVREWRGKRYQVTVVEGGFDYEGKLYRSLTGVAKAITGTHWNGRVFFGIDRLGRE